MDELTYWKKRAEVAEEKLERLMKIRMEMSSLNAAFHAIQKINAADNEHAAAEHQEE